MGWNTEGARPTENILSAFELHLVCVRVSARACMRVCLETRVRNNTNAFSYAPLKA